MLPVDEVSRTAEARRLARGLACESNFVESRAEQVAIVTTEICTNILKHGGGGQVHLRAGRQRDLEFVEVLGLDQGPGFANVSERLRDGFSSAGTMGTGLGAIRRLSSFWDLSSQAGTGTVILARLASTTAVLESHPVDGISTPMPGEIECGDAWGIRDSGANQILVVADGLGHGPAAAAASRAAIDFLFSAPVSAPVDMLKGLHDALRATRGAAVAVAHINREDRTVTFAGLGNISARICESGVPSKNLISMHGTAGAYGTNRFREFSYPWPEESVLILHSDGLSARWDITDYPGLLARDAALICGVLYRDHCRGTDDATVVAVK